MQVHGCSGHHSSSGIARGLKRLKLLQRLRSSRVARDLSSSASSSASSWNSSITSASSWDENRCYYHSDDDGDEEEELYLPKDVPEGSLAVYVGDERKRFVVDARHLNHPWFKILLEQSAEEYGFDHKGGLALPCRVSVFESLLGVLERGETPSSKQLARIEQELLASG